MVKFYVVYVFGMEFVDVEEFLENFNWLEEMEVKLMCRWI